MNTWIDRAEKVIRRCEELACWTDEPGHTTRTFLSPATREVHACLRQWMEELGMKVRLDAAGNLRGVRAVSDVHDPVLYLGSHIDTVPHAGAFDGVLGVVLAIALVEALEDRRLHFAIEVVAFSEEEGVRFGVPFIGSRALSGAVNAELLARRDTSGRTVADAIREFGLDPQRLPEAAMAEGARGYLEFHIEQGPVLESLHVPLGIVESIAGQSRFGIVFEGRANHAGTTPAPLRRDALAGAAEWIGRVEREACLTPDLRATVGSLDVQPGAANVIAGQVRATLDVRHTSDEVRRHAVASLLDAATQIATRRGLTVSWEQRLDQPATPMHPSMIGALERAVTRAGFPVHRLASGAGHDAMVMAAKCPTAMLFLRSPGGISHHPDEAVLPGDVAAALAVGLAFLEEAEALCG
jgi:allantoate deiminase